MSRTRHPRRFPAFALLFSVLIFSAAHDAAAQERRGREQSERGGAATILGTPNALACSAAMARADRTDEAVRFCTVALNGERLSRDARQATLINRGSIYLQRQEWQLALTDFDEVAQRDPENAEAQLNRGAAMIMLGRRAEAIAAITEALSLGVQSPHKAYFNRGMAREQLGDLRGAYEDYSTALEIQPDWGPAEAELARFARGRRDQLAQRLEESPEGAN